MSNLTTFLNNTAAYRRSLRVTEYGDPGQDGDALRRLSPITYIDRVTGPAPDHPGRQRPPGAGERGPADAGRPRPPQRPARSSSSSATRATAPRSGTTGSRRSATHWSSSRPAPHGSQLDTPLTILWRTFRAEGAWLACPSKGPRYASPLTGRTIDPALPPMRLLIRTVLLCLVVTAQPPSPRGRAGARGRPNQPPAPPAGQPRAAALKAQANQLAARYAAAQTAYARLGDQVAALERQVSDLEGRIGRCGGRSPARRWPSTRATSPRPPSPASRRPRPCCAPTAPPTSSPT